MKDLLITSGTHDESLQSRGFTLIELSVVLVIIGLITSDVLVGKDLIRNAELRKHITITDQYSQAVFTFRNKYNCIPGDCPRAQNFFTGTFNGNGNSIIDASPVGVEQPIYIGTEFAYFQDHLIRAKLVPGAEFNAQTADTQNCDCFAKLSTNEFFAVRRALGENSMGAVVGRFSHWYYMGIQRPDYSGPDFWSIDLYTPLEAYSIDAKIDDGVATTGKTRANIGDYWYSADVYATPAACSAALPASLALHGLKTGTCDYDTTVGDRNTGLVIDSPF